MVNEIVLICDVPKFRELKQGLYYSTGLVFVRQISSAPLGYARLSQQQGSSTATIPDS